MISSEDAMRKPLPAPDADSADFWRGLRDGVLLLQHCADCGHVQYYQQAICRHAVAKISSIVRQAGAARYIPSAWYIARRVPRSRQTSPTLFC